MASEKNISKILLSDFDIIRRLLYDISLRGYKSKGEYNELMYGEDNTEKLLPRLRMYLELSGEKEILTGNSGKGGYKYICMNYDPACMPCNPVDYTWRTAEVSVTDVVLWLLIMNVIGPGKKPKSFASLRDGVKNMLDQMADNPLEHEEAKDYLSDKMIRNRLEVLVSEGFVEKKGTGAGSRFLPADDLFGDFSERELEKICTLAEFMQNTSPFELPYFFLNKRIRLLLETVYKNHKSDIPFVVCRNHFPTTVLSSDVLYAFLKAKKSGELIGFLWDINNYALQPGEKWNKKTKQPYYTYSPEIGFVKSIIYDCGKGEITVSVDGLDGEVFTGLISDIRLPNETEKRNCFERYIERLSGEKQKTAKEYLASKEKSPSLLSPVTGEFTEELLREWNMLDTKGSTGERRKTILERFSIDWKIDRSEVEKLFNLVEYRENTENPVRVLDMGKLPVLPARIEKEALKNMVKSEYASVFLEDELMEKISNKLKNYESSWDISDIEIKGKKNGIGNSPKCGKVEMLLKCIKRGEFINLKNNITIEPVRIEYLIYKDEWRLLVSDQKGSERFYYIGLSQVPDTGISTGRRAVGMGNLEEDLKRRVICHTLYINWTAGEELLPFLPIASARLLNILSAYDHKTEYRKSKEKNGFVVSVYTEPEDFDHLLKILRDSSAGNFEIRCLTP